MSFEIVYTKEENVKDVVFNSNWIKFEDGGTFYLPLPLNCDEDISAYVTNDYDSLLAVAKSNVIALEDIPYGVRSEIE